MVLTVILLSGCNVTTDHSSDYVYEFTMYSGGVAVYHDIVYDYNPITSYKYQVFKTKEDKHNDKFTMLVGEVVYKKMTVAEAKLISDHAPLNYPIRFTDTPTVATPVPKATEVEY